MPANADGSATAQTKLTPSISISVEGAGITSSPSTQQYYVVQPGDNLRSIAQKTLGNEMRWPEIWSLNQGQRMVDGRVAQNPDLIFPGWKLEIPVAATNLVGAGTNTGVTAGNGNGNGNNSQNQGGGNNAVVLVGVAPLVEQL